MATADIRKPLRIKFLSKTDEKKIISLWSPLIPNQGFPDVQFTFDAKDQNYNFLAIYKGLPKWDERAPSRRFETLSCSRANTLLITTEQSSIRIDGSHFIRQFGHVLTSKSQLLTQHPNHIHETPPLRWFYDRALEESGEHLSFDELTRPPPTKTKSLSTVCSTKRMSHTVHSARLDFITKLRRRLPELEVFGRGIQPVSDKAEAMRDYRYHISIENHIESGHWTEKLADCFLAGCLPFYFGDPDYAETFPENSVIPIDIFDFESATKIIRDAIAQDALSCRQSELQVARRMVLEKYNTLGWVARFALKNYKNDGVTSAARIYNRHAFRQRHPFKAMSDISFRTRMKFHPSAQPLQRASTTPR